MKKILVLLVLFSSNVYALSLLEIRNQVRRNVEDLNITSALESWTDTELNFLINQGQREICDETYCLYTSSSITTVAGTQEYTLDSDIQFVDRVIYDNLPLVKKTIQELDREISTWLSTSSGTPTSYYIDYEKKRVGVYPKPGTGTLILYHQMIPTDLSSDADIPFNTVYKYYPYHHVIIDYVLSYIYYQIGDQKKYDWAQQRYYFGLNRFKRNVMSTNKHIRKLQQMENQGGGNQ